MLYSDSVFPGFCNNVMKHPDFSDIYEILIDFHVLRQCE